MPSITINYPLSDGQRLAAAVGKSYNLLGADGKQRSATAAECKQWLIDRAWDAIMENELPALQQSALSTVTVIPVSLT